MTATTAGRGTAERWGPLWGARPQDWAATEEQQAPTYEDAIRHVPIRRGQAVLELGCGSGVFLRMAADAGAVVSGVDASPALLEIARSRVPDADLRTGDLQFLPHAADSFDVVAGFNSFFFAADMTEALREAGRVAKPDAPVIIQVWGRPDRCDLEKMKHALAPFLPPPDPDAPRGSELWEPGVLEQFATAAGLRPGETFDTAWAYRYADEDALVRGMLSAGGIALIAERVGGGTVERAVADSLAPCRQPDGTYRVANEWHTLVAYA